MSSKSNFLVLSLRQIFYYGMHGTLPNLSPVLSHDRQIAKPALLGRHLIVFLICLSIILMVSMRILDWGLPSPNDAGEGLQRWAHVALLAFLFLFVLEYLVRFWTATEAHPDFHDDAEELESDIASHHYRLSYVFSFMGMIDLLVIASLVYSLLTQDFGSWPSFVMVLALFKFSRFIPGLDLVGTVIKNERQTLSALVLTLGILVIVLSTALYLIENAAQPDMFKSVANSMWWGIVTMTTTGYGDMAPVTWIGRVIGACAMLVGIAMLAMPAGILSNGFAEEIKRREQLRAWQIISNLELFAGLESGCIADIANCLKTQIVPARSAVVKKNAIADSMFFIVDGEVEVEIKPKPPAPIRLKTGDIFGEAGLIDNKRRNATIRTVKTTRFLVLELRDFHQIANEHPELMDRIRAIDEQRKS
jgi:voltage-gated potassium channel